MDIEYPETKKRSRDSFLPLGAKETLWALKTGSRYGVVCIDHPQARIVGYSVDHDLRLRMVKPYGSIESTEAKKRRF